MPKYMSSKSGKIAEFESEFDETGIDHARESAIQKGWIPAVEVVSPKSGQTAFVPQEKLKEAQTKGWIIREEHDARSAPVGSENPADAFVAGYGQGFQGGFGDEISGALKPTEYKETRDSIRQYNKETQDESPWAYGTGEVIGGLVSPINKVAKGGAALGAVAGLGYSDADLTEGDIAGAGIDTAIGSGAGKLVEKGIEKAAPKAGEFKDWLAKYMKKKSLEEGERALRYTKGELRRTTPAQRARTARTLVDDYLDWKGALKEEKLLGDMHGAKTNIEGAVKNIDDFLTSQGKDISPGEVLNDIEGRIAKLDTSGAEGPEVSALKGLRDSLYERLKSESTPERVSRYRAFQNVAYKKGQVGSPESIRAESADAAKDALKKDFKRQVRAAGDPGDELVRNLESADQRSHELLSIGGLSDRVLQRQSLDGGLSRISGAVAGDGAGDVVDMTTGKMIGLLAHLAMKRKNQLMAVYANKAQKLLSSPRAKEIAPRLEQAAKRGIIPFIEEIQNYRDEE